jgi:hypothetical protein
MGYPLGSFVWEHLLYTLLTEAARELVGAWSVRSGMGFVVPVYWLLLLSLFSAAIATATTATATTVVIVVNCSMDSKATTHNTARIKQQNYETINLFL